MITGPLISRAFQIFILDLPPYKAVPFSLLALYQVPFQRHKLVEKEVFGIFLGGSRGDPQGSLASLLSAASTIDGARVRNRGLTLSSIPPGKSREKGRGRKS